MSGGYPYYPSNGVVESLISSGDINLIQNDTLKKYLVSWKDVLTKYVEYVKIDYGFWLNTLEPYIINNGNFWQLRSEENFNMIKDRVFINMLVRKQHYNRSIAEVIQSKNSIETYMRAIIRLSKTTQ
jgi:hypothetical protein